MFNSLCPLWLVLTKRVNKEGRKMKKTLKTVYLFSAVLLIGTILIFIGTQIQKKRVFSLKEIVEVQKEEIERLKQQEIIWQQKIEDKQAVQDRNKAIAKKFLKTWKAVVGRDAPYENVVINDGIMKIYFADGYEATAFIANPEVISRFALDYFLRETGRSMGAVEYYTPLKKKIFSMSGSSSATEIKKY